MVMVPQDNVYSKVVVDLCPAALSLAVPVRCVK